MTTAASTKRLDAEQVAQFQKEGYLIFPEPVFRDENTFCRLRKHFDRKLEALLKDERPEAIDVPHFTDTALFEWALHPDVLDIVEPLTGPDIVLFATHFLCKPRGDGRRVPWHEDSAYWKTMLDPMEVVTVWLAIDPSTKVNGCMYVIPHTHNTGMKGFSDYEAVDVSQNVFSTEIVKKQRQEDLAVACELQPNHCSLHDGRLIHGSAPNTSSIRRCGWTIRFIPAHVKLNPAVYDRHVLYLARGRNLAGQPMGDPTCSYTELMAHRRKQFGVRSH